jgi:hypothetical protein
MVAAEVERTKQEALRSMDTCLSAKTDQLNKFAAMLANPNLQEECKAVIADLFTTVVKELKAMSDAGGGAACGTAANSAAGGAADMASGGAASFTTPKKQGPSNGSSV